MFVAPFGFWLSLSLHCEREHASNRLSCSREIKIRNDEDWKIGIPEWGHFPMVKTFPNIPTFQWSMVLEQPLRGLLK